MEEERIAINGMKFKAERLISNYAGQYTCMCEECIFDKDWVDFGDESPCRKVACIRNKWHDGNRNVWAVDGSLDDLKRKPVTWWVEYTYKYRWWNYDERLWQEEEDSNAQRFFCREEEINDKVRTDICDEIGEEDAEDSDVRLISFDVYDHYITTDYEV